MNWEQLPWGLIALVVCVVIAIGALAGIAWLIRQVAGLKGFIREAAGVKETQSTEIAGQPITVKAATEYLEASAMARIQAMIDEVKTGHVNGDKALEKRIDELAEQLEKNRDAAAREQSARAGKLHARIDELKDEVAGMPAKVVDLLKQTKGLLS